MAKVYVYVPIFKMPEPIFEKWKNDTFQPQKLPINISEKNETKATHRITFRASNSVNNSLL